MTLSQKFTVFLPKFYHFTGSEKSSKLIVLIDVLRLTLDGSGGWFRTSKPFRNFHGNYEYCMNSLCFQWWSCEPVYPISMEKCFQGSVPHKPDQREVPVGIWQGIGWGVVAGGSSRSGLCYTFRLRDRGQTVPGDRMRRRKDRQYLRGWVRGFCAAIESLNGFAIPGFFHLFAYVDKQDYLPAVGDPELRIWRILLHLSLEIESLNGFAIPGFFHLFAIANELATL